MLSCRHAIGQLLLLGGGQVRRHATSASAQLLDHRRYVELTQVDGRQLKYPSVWLRDNCQCSECFHGATRARKSHWERGPLNAQAERVSYDEQRQQLIVTWQDAHKSSYDLDWLKQRDFSQEARQRYLDLVYKPPVQLWGKSQFSEVTREFAYQDVIDQDAVLRAWLEALAVQGFALLRGAPDDVNVARHLAERIGYIKRTTYG